LATTGVLLAVGLTVTEAALFIMGLLVLDAGPIGVAVDVAFVIPVELFLVDVEIGTEVSIYNTITSGTHVGNEPKFILIPAVKKIVKKLSGN